MEGVEFDIDLWEFPESYGCDEHQFAESRSIWPATCTFYAIDDDDEAAYRIQECSS